MAERQEPWSREEVEATVADYFDMLAADLTGIPYSKAEHRRALARKLNSRSEGSIEFKHCNISAVLIELGFPYISGYKRRDNYQTLLYDVVAERLQGDRYLQDLAAQDVELPVQVPTVDDILKALIDPPKRGERAYGVAERIRPVRTLKVNYLEREAHNRTLGEAGEEFVLNFERARLMSVGRENLAAKIEHVSRTQGDGAGFDILSYERSGTDRLIEVKTTKYGQDTPFFVSRNEVDVSQVRAGAYQLYRVFEFRKSPRLFTLAGPLSSTCELRAASFVARVA
jgi:hypothetical protein